MARKRRLADPLLGARLFGGALERLRGGGTPATPPALAALVGDRVAARPRTPAPSRQACTVYLSAGDLDDAARIAELWGAERGRRVTRSEVVRRALHDLRLALEAQQTTAGSP